MSFQAQALIERSLPFQEVREAADNGMFPVVAAGITTNAKPFYADALAASLKRPLVFIAGNEQSAREMADQAGQDALFLPDADVPLRNVEGKSRSEEMERIQVLKQASQAKLVFMSIEAALQRVPPKDVFLSACMHLEPGEELDLRTFVGRVSENCYERTGTVYNKGEFSLRGEIIDIFPPDSAMPLRLTLFDDEIESIRCFDPDTQKSVGKPLHSYDLPPAHEAVLTKEQQERLIEYLEKQKEQGRPLADDLLSDLREFGSLANVESFLSLLYPPVSAVDYFDNAVLMFDSLEYIRDAAQRLHDEFETEYAQLEAHGGVLPLQKEWLLPINYLLDGREKDMIDASGVTESILGSAAYVDLATREAQPYHGNMALLSHAVADRIERGYHVYLFAGKKAVNLASALSDFDLDLPILETVTGTEKAVIVPEALPYGFEVDDVHIIVLGQNDIFGRTKKKIRKKSKGFAENIFNDLKPGDIIVHDLHGKGKYLGLKTMKVGGVVAEYMEVEYRDGDKLFVPTDQIDGVQKYIGSGDGDVILSKLGSREWENAKTKARESTRKLAFDMMKLYSARFSGKGHAFSPDTVWQKEFEDAFPYEETEGQKDSSEDIKRDMESPRVMDRLLLGDVGYGKTEVAMRAAFKAVMDGKQVAVLVPTTLLARQHLKTFQERFKGFPVKIAGMSRFGKREHAKTLKGLKDGSVDIVIGTHRLLSADVQFKDLGLLIVDEEQRFGVNHKEKLKTLKESVDVLTLSATPIPRTLEMSLTGIRDMSTIETPPVMKKVPHTYVTRYSQNLIHEAVQRELKRGGQVYFVCRQIQQMDKLVEDVQKAVPNARIGTAHGRMNEQEIEDVVSGFIDGEYDVLVCTTIIENGIDIPNVNTIIVYESDKFGLSQLYQLKGRVGRSDKTAYAYFTYQGEDGLNDDGRKRLQAIREFTELGSGFKIAMRDLQIRGAGNLLGADQSGHMTTVGYAMYCRMMSEAVDLAKGIPVEEEQETTVNLGLPMLIPDAFTADESNKMDIYRMIATIRNIADAKAVMAEIQDRYGKLPGELDNLILTAVIRAYASRAGFASVVRYSDRLELKYQAGQVPNVKRLLQIAEKNPEHVILKPTEPPTLVYKTKRMPGRQFLELLAALGSEKEAQQRADAKKIASS